MNNLSPGDPPQIGRFRLLGRLGRGGMGTVYLGADDSGQRVAIKVINPELTQHEQFRLRFRREAEAARRVRRFCTAAVLDAALDGGQLYVVTEYVPGPSLEEAVRSGGPLRGSSLDALAVGVATALTAIHGAGIVHRDLKPSNVLLSPVGPRVIDFGIARALDSLDGVTGTGEIIGTPRYMAPEILHGGPVTPACDVFSWGCLVAFAASGRPPFRGDALPAVLYQVLNAEPDLEGMEPSLREPVRQALAKDPARRPTAQQLLDHLVGRAAGPEQAAHSVQAVWQQGEGVQPHAAPGMAAPHITATTPQTAPQTAPLNPGTVPGTGAAGGAVPTGGSSASGFPAGGFPEQSTAGYPHTGPTGYGGAPPGVPPGTPPGVTQGASPGARSRAGRRKVLIGGVAAAVVAAAGIGAYAVLSSGGPPTDLRLLYQDDFTQSGTGWSGGTYTGEASSRYGYAPEGFYALDVDGDNEVKRETAPIPFVPQQPATPDPSATPTPTTPDRLLVGVDVWTRDGTEGPGETGLFCRGADEYKATRYEFLLDTTGKARIRRTEQNSGGDLAGGEIARLEKDRPVRLQAECTGVSGGVRLTMWVDGRQVATYVDQSPLANGHVGMLARVGEKSAAKLKVGFDNFTVHGPPAAGTTGTQ